jgi:hypothetical protein
MTDKQSAPSRACSEDMILAANERIQTVFAETAILLTHPDASRRELAKELVYSIMFEPAQQAATHHAELVEELAEATEVAKGCARRELQYFADRKELLLALKRSRIALNRVPTNDKRFSPANHAAIKVATDIIDEALAKIGEGQ